MGYSYTVNHSTSHVRKKNDTDRLSSRIHTLIPFPSYHIDSCHSCYSMDGEHHSHMGSIPYRSWCSMNPTNCFHHVDRTRKKENYVDRQAHKAIRHTASYRHIETDMRYAWTWTNLTTTQSWTALTTCDPIQPRARTMLLRLNHGIRH
jgi:hypothetical protein